MDARHQTILAASERHSDYRVILLSALARHDAISVDELTDDEVEILAEAADTFADLTEASDLETYASVFGRDDGIDCTYCDAGWVMAPEPGTGDETLQSCPHCGGIDGVGVIST